MKLSVRSSTLDEIAPWRDMYRVDMACQIIHDSIHVRPGWSDEYAMGVDGVHVGYGSVAVSGPWTELATRLFLATSRAVSIEMQSNDRLSHISRAHC